LTEKNEKWGGTNKEVHFKVRIKYYTRNTNIILNDLQIVQIKRIKRFILNDLHRVLLNVSFSLKW
jgi:hypothetical protein